MVVDDQADLAEMMAAMIKRDGHEVRTATSGPEAVAAVEERRPDLVLTDLGMPGMSGLDRADGLGRALAAPVRRPGELRRPARGRPPVRPGRRQHARVHARRRAADDGSRAWPGAGARAAAPRDDRLPIDLLPAGRRVLGRGRRALAVALPPRPWPAELGPQPGRISAPSLGLVGGLGDAVADPGRDLEALRL